MQIKMEMKDTRINAYSKEDIPLSKGRRSKNTRADLLEEMSIGNVSCTKKEDGVMRMKIVVRKQDLRALLQAMDNEENNYIDLVPSLSVEGHLNHFCRKQLLKRKYAFKEGLRMSWYPELQSIPEEF